MASVTVSYPTAAEAPEPEPEAPAPLEPEPEAPAAAAQPRLDSLTGLRFFAAFVVLALHFAVIFSGGSPSLLRQERLYNQGGVGVSFFFLLSGFVLTWSHQPGDHPLRFMRRRAARILPLHVVTTGLAVVVVFAVGAPWPGNTQALRSLLLLPTWVPYWSSHKVLDSPSWSLGCELFFYALFPLLLWVLRRCPPSVRWFVALGCIWTPIVLAIAVNPTNTLDFGYWLIYYCPPIRLLEFVLGMILALEVARGRMPRIPLLPVAAMTVAVYFADGWANLAESPVAVTLIPFAVLVVAAAQSDVARRYSLLRSRVLVALGVWSFAFYLAHYPLMTALAYAMKGSLNASATIFAGVVSLVGTLIAAALLHIGVERPLEARLRGSRPRARSAARQRMTAAGGEPA